MSPGFKLSKISRGLQGLSLVPTSCAGGGCEVGQEIYLLRQYNYLTEGETARMMRRNKRGAHEGFGQT